MKQKKKKLRKGEVSEGVLERIGRIIPGFNGLFKKMEKSKIFGARMTEIRKEIERRFG